jgi:hypothetical protein
MRTRKPSARRLAEVRPILCSSPSTTWKFFSGIAHLLEMRRLHIQLDPQRATLEDALRARSLELREAHLHLENVRA